MATSTITPVPAERTQPAPKTDTASPIVLDLGKHRRKAVRRLRRGTGPLLEDVTAAIDELRAAGAIAASAQPVIVVVQQRRKRKLPSLPGF